jgi:hypothetical protein
MVVGGLTAITAILGSCFTGWVMANSEGPPLNPKAVNAVGEQPGRRLDSWKEIASWFNRSEKTVRRWEEREGLPVHRLLHDKRGTVYAYIGELEAWRQSRMVNDKRISSLLTCRHWRRRFLRTKGRKVPEQLSLLNSFHRYKRGNAVNPARGPIKLWLTEER